MLFKTADHTEHCGCRCIISDPNAFTATLELSVLETEAQRGAVVQKHTASFGAEA